MTRRGGEPAPAELITYCIVPRDLAARLLTPLRRHFAGDEAVEVIVEQRGPDRRASHDRRERAAAGDPAADRRLVRDAAGRRVAERRAVLAPATVPELPRKAAPFAERIVFVERLAPSSERLEDLDTLRIVHRFQAGDEDAFSELYLRYFDRAYRYLQVALSDDHAAEDLAQQVFVKVFEALPRYERSRAPFRAWLFTIVRNQALTELSKRQRVDLVEASELERRREREPQPEDVDLSALDWISDKDLLLFFERLPLAQRQVLLLRYMLDLPHAEVAKILGRTPDDVRHLQSRALAFMRARLTALGRAPSRSRLRTLRCPKQAPVLRMRRFSLISSS